MTLEQKLLQDNGELMRALARVLVVPSHWRAYEADLQSAQARCRALRAYLAEIDGTIEVARIIHQVDEIERDAGELARAAG